MTTDADYEAIRRVVDDWVIFRDSGAFDRLAGLWHEDGEMKTTWAQVSATDFVKRSRAAFEGGAHITHFHGGFHCDIVGNRAIAQTKVTITQRADIDGVTCEAVCLGRFYDFFARRDGCWKIVLRQPIYESDRLSPVRPAESLVLDETLLTQFPVGYQHLGYLQTKLGMTVKTDMPGLRGPETEALYARGAAWLEGEDLSDRRV